MPAPPLITLPNSECFPLFSDALFVHFAGLSAPLQRKIVRKMEEFIDDMHAHENPQYLVEAEYIGPEAAENMQPGELEKVREMFLTQITWRLALCYQVRTTSYLVYVSSYLMFVSYHIHRAYPKHCPR